MKNEKRYEFTCFDLFMSAVSIFASFLGLCADVYLLYTYAIQKPGWIFCITCVIIAVPSIVLIAFSIQWHRDDKRATVFTVCLNCFFLGIIHRQVVAFLAGWNARQSKNKEDFRVLYHHMRDLSVLDLYKSFLKSAPQLVLQLYIVFDTKDWSFSTVFFCAYAMVTLPLCMATYDRAERRWDPKRPQISWCGSILQFMWRFGTVGSRIGAMVLRGIVNDAWAMFIFGTHFAVTTIFSMVATYLMVKKEVAADATCWQKFAHCIAMGAGFTFCFINVGDNIKDSISSAFIILMYTYTGQENLESIVTYHEEWTKGGYPMYGKIAMILVAVSFIIGVICMCIYRKCYHPTCEVTLFPNRTPFVPNADAQAVTLTEYECEDPQDDKAQILPINT